MNKKRRVKRADEFQNIIKGKKSEVNSKFVIYYKDKKEEKARTGISVGKKWVMPFLEVRLGAK